MNHSDCFELHQLGEIVFFSVTLGPGAKVHEVLYDEAGVPSALIVEDEDGVDIIPLPDLPMITC